MSDRNIRESLNQNEERKDTLINLFQDAKKLQEGRLFKSFKDREIKLIKEKTKLSLMKSHRVLERRHSIHGKRELH